MVNCPLISKLYVSKLYSLQSYNFCPQQTISPPPIKCTYFISWCVLNGIEILRRNCIEKLQIPAKISKISRWGVRDFSKLWTPRLKAACRTKVGALYWNGRYVASCNYTNEVGSSNLISVGTTNCIFSAASNDNLAGDGDHFHTNIHPAEWKCLTELWQSVDIITQYLAMWYPCLEIKRVGINIQNKMRIIRIQHYMFEREKIIPQGQIK